MLKVLIVLAMFFPFLVALLFAGFVVEKWRRYDARADRSDITGRPVTMTDY